MRDHFDRECRVVFLDDILIISCLLRQGRDGCSRVHGVELVGERLGCCTAPIGNAIEFFRNHATLYNKVLHLSKHHIADLHSSMKKIVMLPTSREGVGSDIPDQISYCFMQTYNRVSCRITVIGKGYCFALAHAPDPYGRGPYLQRLQTMYCFHIHADGA